MGEHRLTTLIDQYLLGTISPEDVGLFHRSDSVDDAFDYITGRLLEGGLPERGPML